MEVNPITNIQEGRKAQPSSEAADKSEGFSGYMKGKTSLDDIFQKAAQKYNVPVELLKAIGKAESNFQADATSHCGAQGIMQLMPATAKSLGVKDAYDPEQNIMGGAKYISQMLKKYDGNIPLALAGYNAGPGNVAKYGGIPPFEETQNYVKKITGFLKEGVAIPNKENFIAAGGGNGRTAINASDTDNQLKETPENISDVIRKMLENNSDIMDDVLEEVFSYEDYGKFLKVYFESMSMTAFMDEESSGKMMEGLEKDFSKMTKDMQEVTANKESKESSGKHDIQQMKISKEEMELLKSARPDIYYTYQSINYNPAIMSLLAAGAENNSK